MVVGDGVVTLNGKLGYATLRDALGAPTGSPRSARPRRTRGPTTSSPTSSFLPVIPNPEKILCAGINYRSHAAETGRELPKQPSMFMRFTNTLTGHEGEMIRPSVSEQFRFRGRAGGGDRPRRPPHPGRARAGSRRRLHLLRRRQRARLPEILGDLGQEFPRHRPARPLDRHDRRNSRSDPAHADHAAQRQGDAALRHRSADLLGAADHRLLLGLHAARRRAT